MKECMRKGIVPMAALGMILIITNEIYMVDGNIDLIRLWMCVGIPFGTIKTRHIWLPHHFDLVSILGGLLMYFVICGFFGGFIAVFTEIEAILVLLNCIIEKITGCRAIGWEEE